MRGILKTFLIIGLAAFVFVGCTGQSDDGGDPNTGPVVLQWWGVFWDEGVVESLIVEYQEANPNVKIEYANKWSGGDREIAEQLYQDEINRSLRDSNVVEIPDIFMVKNTWLGEYVDYTAAAPVAVTDANTVRTAYYPAVSQDFIINGEVEALPLWIDVMAILYNRDLLNADSISAPASTWQDFRTQAKQLTKRNGAEITQAGFGAGTADNVSFDFELLNLLFLQNGVRMVNNQGNPTFSTSAFAEETVQFYQSFADSDGSWSDDLEEDALEFTEGRLAMMVAPSWQYHDILYFNQLYNLGLDIGVAPVPQVQNQGERIDWATYWGNAVSEERPNVGEAWKFVNWLSQPAQLRKLRENEALNREFFGFLYPRADMQQDLLGDDYLSVYNNALPTAQSWLMVNGLEVKSIFAELIESAGTASNVATAENQVEEVFSNAGVF